MIIYNAKINNDTIWLGDISNQKHIEVINYFLKTISFDEVKKIFVVEGFLNFNNFNQKIKQVKPIKGKEQEFKKFKNIKTMLKYFDVITALAWLDITTDKTLSLKEIERKFNIIVDNDTLNELCYLSFENIDPFNLKDNLIICKNKTILKIKDNNKITPYFMTSIKNILESRKENIYIDDESLKKIYKNNIYFFKIDSYLTLTTEQINYIYDDFLNINEYEKYRSLLSSFLMKKQRYKQLKNYNNILKIKQKFNYLECSIIDLFVKPEFCFNTYHCSGICEDTKIAQEIYSNIKLLQNSFLNKNLRYKLLCKNGLCLDKYSHNDIVNFLDTMEKELIKHKTLQNWNDNQMYFAIQQNDFAEIEKLYQATIRKALYGILYFMNDKEIHNLISFLLQNNHFTKCKTILKTASFFNRLPKQTKQILQTCKEHHFNPNYITTIND